MPPLISLLADAPSPGPLIAAAKLGARFWQGPPITRLLTLLHHDFGERTSLSRDRFYAWQTDAELMTVMTPVLDGSAVADEATIGVLAEQLAPKLTETSLGDRNDLAREMAEAIVRAPSAVLRGDERSAYLVTADRRDGARLSKVQESTEATQAGIQRVLRVLGARDDDVVAALVGDPLRHAGVAERAERAGQLAEDGEHHAAAEELQAVAEGLVTRGLAELAEAFVLRAAEAYVAADDRTAATDLLVSVVWARLDRGQPTAASSVLGTLRATCEPDRAWIGQAVEAEVNWPERGGADAALAYAGDRTDDATRRARWWATWATARTVEGGLDEVASLDPSVVQLSDGPAALTVHMLALAARMRLARADEPDTWALVEDWAETALDSEAGRAWSLRGAALALVGDEAGAIRAYRRAMVRWGRDRDGQEQAGRQLLCLQAAQQLFGATPSDLELRPLAMAMRGRLGSPASVIARLDADGSSDMLDEDWPDARRALTHAYALAIASGDLHATTVLEGKLARLYRATDRPTVALAFALRGGDGKLARALAPTVRGSEIADVLLPTGAPWQRSATWVVVAQVAERLPEAWIAAHADAALSDASGRLSPILAPTPAAFAPEALAAMLPAVPDARLDRALQVVRDGLVGGLVGLQRRAARALQDITDAGRSDESTELVEELIRADSRARVDPQWVHDRLAARPDLRQRVEAAATEGHPGALEVLLHDDSPPADAVARMESLVAKFAETPTVTRSEDGRELSVGMGIRFELAGLAGEHVAYETRERLLARLLRVVDDPHEPSANRYSALGALFNLAHVLDHGQAARVLAAAVPAACGHVPASRFDSGPTDLLSRFRFSVPGVDTVQAMAVELVGRLEGLGHGDLANALSAITTCLRDGRPMVLAAALRSINWLSSPSMPASLPDLLRHPDVDVRRSALVLWRRCYPRDELADPARGQVLDDTDPGVRAAAVDIASETADRPLLETLAADEHLVVRWRAREALRSLESENPPADA